MQRHGISEDWLLRHGNEKVWSCEPGSIFGRVTRRRQFGHPPPFSPLATASEDDLKRILQRGPALLSFGTKPSGAGCWCIPRPSSHAQKGRRRRYYVSRLWEAAMRRLWKKTPFGLRMPLSTELHVRSFCDSSGDGIGDFRGLCEKLGYFEELGVTALWLLLFIRLRCGTTVMTLRIITR